MAPSSMVISTGCSRASRRTRAPSSGLQNLQCRLETHEPYRSELGHTLKYVSMLTSLDVSIHCLNKQ